MTGYAVKYRAEFNGIRKNTIYNEYKLDIYQKDFKDDYSNLLFSNSPIIQEWQDDDPKKAIRGCSLTASFITDSTGVKLTDFYSDDDLQFYCEYRCMDTDQLLFAGFLLQDDCNEVQLDFNHEIKLVFTDMLGTLKDVTLNQAAIIIGTTSTGIYVDVQNFYPAGNNTIQSFNSNIGILKAGDKFTLYDGTTNYNFVCYNITYSSILGYLINVGINPGIPSYFVTYELKYKIPYSLTGTIPLIDIIKLCVKSTYIDDIGLRSYTNIYPVSTSGVEEIWQDTYVHAEDYYDGNNWMNCYDILERLMDRFNCSLMQVDGFWTIMRWAEIFNYAVVDTNNVRYHYWDNDFNYLGYAINYIDFQFFNGSDLETGVMKSVIRPKQYIMETMTYQNPEFLKNQDLNDVGALINQYSSGGNTVYEYELPYWIASVVGVIKFIRVVKDSNDNEIERYLVTTNVGTATDIVIQYEGIELSTGDKINFSFSFITSSSEPGPINLIFQIYIDDGINPTHKINTDGSWQTTGGYSYSVASGDNLNNTHNVQIQSQPIPFDCKLKLFLGFYCSSSTDETHFSDISFNVTNSVNDYLRISGHQNKDSQSKELKNNIDKSIDNDNTPRSSIKGSLFTNQFVGLIQQRTNQWEYPGGFIQYNSLGLVTTQEEMYQSYKPRTKYEGNLLYLLKGSGPYQFVNPISIFLINVAPNQYRFVPGKVSIDYKNNSVNLTLYEIIDTESGFDNQINDYLYWAANNTFYEFKYLYDK